MTEKEVLQAMITEHRVHKDYLIMLLEIEICSYYDDYFTIEKSIRMDMHHNSDYIRLMKELKVLDESTSEVKLNKLDGTGVEVTVEYAKNGTLKVNHMSLDRDYYDFCEEKDKRIERKGDYFEKKYLEREREKK